MIKQEIKPQVVEAQFCYEHKIWECGWIDGPWRYETTGGVITRVYLPGDAGAPMICCHNSAPDSPVCNEHRKALVSNDGTPPASVAANVP